MAQIEPMDGGPKPPMTPKQKAGVAGGASAAVIALALAVTGLKPDEGKRNVTYLDIASIPTYCYGHADRSAKVGSYHTDAQCDALLSKDAKSKEDAVLKCAHVLANRPYQLAASVRLAFNIGEGKFCSSSIAKNFNAGNMKAACAGFPAWRLVNGKVIQGLVERRMREMAQCQTRL